MTAGWSMLPGFCFYCEQLLSDNFEPCASPALVRILDTQTSIGALLVYYEVMVIGISCTSTPHAPGQAMK